MPLTMRGSPRSDGALLSDASRKSAAKVAQLLGDDPKEEDIVTVEIGTSARASEQFCRRTSQMVNESYGYNRLSAGEVRSRLAMGDAEDEANRVLHLAFRNGELVGC